MRELLLTSKYFVATRKSRHWWPTVWLYKLSSFPLPSNLLREYHIADVLRFLVLAALNIAFAINENQYTTDYKLYGWLTIANGGLNLLLATRSNLFSIVLRLPSPVILQYHRWIGTFTFIHATTHVAFNIMHDIETDQIASQFESPRIQVGILAWICLSFMFLSSLPIVRRRLFEVFYYIHFLFFIFMVGALYHTTNGPEFLLPGFSLWVVDRALRVWHDFRKIDVESVQYYAGDLTKFKVTGAWRAQPGQIVWIQLPKVSFLNWHPFTVAQVTNDDKPVTTIAIRGLGSYTRSVQQLPGAGNGDGAKSLRLRVDGPYGIGRFNWAKAQLVVLVGGGVGITPGLSIASFILQNAHKDATSKQVHLLWIVKDKSHVAWFAEELKQLYALSQQDGCTVSFSVMIHVTDSLSGGDSTLEMQPKETNSVDDRLPWDLHTGRPNMGAWIRNIKSNSGAVDACVNLCGPAMLLYEARKACISESDAKTIFYVEDEVFHL
ncbi:hypothetical protein VHEMI05459 [[Torrubiella] hemipterigena]|uniref:FAD-binding FR-type domain-containing protein n=1 Tax=[Torrubiella] hemipterigena TaxID=1531966 RepID=A0A0A1TGQ3_9HYPO|nr:hypothetical protein VHEMI05459 [[Torrubiella] hemipterigena]